MTVKEGRSQSHAKRRETTELSKALANFKRLRSDSVTEISEIANEYTLGKILGHGQFGIVRMVHKAGNSSKPLVMKLYSKMKLLQANALVTVEVNSDNQNEIEILKRLDHPNIIKLVESHQSSQSIQVVLQYGGTKNLFDFVESNKLSGNSIREIFTGVCHAVKYLHERSICHRDIKLENIVVSDDCAGDEVTAGQVKLIDFGFALQVKDKVEAILQQVGTPAYMSPELALKQPYDGFKADIWALGVLLYRMNYKELPYRARDCFELYDKITSGSIKFAKAKDSQSIILQELISSMMTKDAVKRPSISEVFRILPGYGSSMVQNIADSH